MLAKSEKNTLKISQIVESPNFIFVKESTNAEPLDIPIKELEHKLGITWVEETLIDGKSVSLREKNQDSLVEQKLKDIAKYRNYLGLIYLGEAIGYCVYSIKDIPRNVFITTYGGEYSTSAEKRGKYTITFAQEEQNNFSRGAINAEKYRNFGGFLTHLPKNKKNYHFNNEEDKNALSIQNVRRYVFKYHGVSLIAIKTTRAIPKNTLLGYDYWPSFEPIKPALFVGLNILNSTSYQQITNDEKVQPTLTLMLAKKKEIPSSIDQLLPGSTKTDKPPSLNNLAKINDATSVRFSNSSYSIFTTVTSIEHSETNDEQNYNHPGFK